jgi:hypothetical protein
MMNKILIPLFLLSFFIPSVSFAFLSIDESDLAAISEKASYFTNIFTNSVSNVTTNITLIQPDSNVIMNPVEKLQIFPLPNAYITNTNGMIPVIPPQHPIRRYDIVFFIAVPITYELMSTLVDQKNHFFENNRSTFNNTDWVTVLLESIVIPAGVAYFDFLYVQKEEAAKKTSGFFPGISWNGDGIGMNVAYLRF